MDKQPKKRRLQTSRDAKPKHSADEFVPNVSTLKIRDDGPPQPLSPINISLIILEIFEYLKLSDLKNCRLMCTLWNDIATQVLRSGNQGKVSFVNSVVQNGIGMESQKLLLLRIKEFTELMNLSPKIPYLRYEFKEVSFRNPAMKKLFKICGSNIKHLSISVTPSKPYLDIQTFTKLLTEYVPNLETLDIQSLTKTVVESNSLHYPGGLVQEFCLPKLKALTFPDYPGTMFGIHRKCGLVWKQIFKGTPILHEIDSHVMYYDNSNLRSEDNNARLEYQALFLKALKDSGRMTTLTILRFDHLQASDFEQLCIGAKEQSMTLLEFKVGQVKDHSAKEPLEKFLKTQSNCLKTLSIGNEYNFICNFAFTFPVMKSLLSLTLTSNNDSQILIQNSDLSKDLPSMISFNLNSFELHSVIQPSLSSIHSKVTNLSITFRQSVENDIATLGKMLPGITSLKYSNACSGQLPIIWKTWPGLKELEVLLDDDFCGSTSGLDEVFATYSEGIKQTLPELNNNFDNPDVIKRLLHPSILDLKELESLTVDLSRSTRVITDATGIYLFSNMKSLKKLKILNGRITKSCEAHIIAMLPSIEVFENVMMDDIMMPK